MISISTLSTPPPREPDALSLVIRDIRKFFRLVRHGSEDKGHGEEKKCQKIRRNS